MTSPSTQSADAGSTRAVTAMVVCALIIRVIVAFGVQAWVDRTPGRLCLIAGDAEGYWELAHSVAERSEFSIYIPPRQVLRMPGFPLWLASGLKLYGDSVLLHRLGLACVGTLACWLTYVLANGLVGTRPAMIAGWLAALSPPLAGISVLLLSETLFAVFLLGSLITFLPVWSSMTCHQAETPTPIGMAITSGLLAACATLVRPTWLPFLPGCAGLLVVLALFRRELKGVFLASAVCIGLTCGLAPWVYRNWQVTGHLVVTTLWAGPSLYDGLHPGATGISEMSFIERDEIYQRMSEYDADQHYRDAAWHFVRENPAKTIQLAFVKLGRYWNPFSNADQFNSPFIRLALGCWGLPLYGLTLVGLWKLRKNAAIWLIAIGPIVFLGSVHTLFIGSVRYRLPAEYALLAPAAAGFVALVDWCKLHTQTRAAER